mmetsp:Transcript_28131/g.51664  ORF Transcript_28131/g.51664 Transcript_28131/m.51664 type:complete len:574 (+) Transcript_28131:54-1775(+)
MHMRAGKLRPKSALSNSAAYHQLHNGHLKAIQATGPRPASAPNKARNSSAYHQLHNGHVKAIQATGRRPASAPNMARGLGNACRNSVQSNNTILIQSFPEKLDNTPSSSSTSLVRPHSSPGVGQRSQVVTIVSAARPKSAGFVWRRTPPLTASIKTVTAPIHICSLESLAKPGYHCRKGASGTQPSAESHIEQLGAPTEWSCAYHHSVPPLLRGCDPRQKAKASSSNLRSKRKLVHERHQLILEAARWLQQKQKDELAVALFDMQEWVMQSGMIWDAWWHYLISLGVASQREVEEWERVIAQGSAKRACADPALSSFQRGDDEPAPLADVHDADTEHAFSRGQGQKATRRELVVEGVDAAHDAEYASSKKAIAAEHFPKDTTSEEAVAAEDCREDAAPQEAIAEDHASEDVPSSEAIASMLKERWQRIQATGADFFPEDAVSTEASAGEHAPEDASKDAPSSSSASSSSKEATASTFKESWPSEVGRGSLRTHAQATPGEPALEDAPSKEANAWQLKAAARQLKDRWRKIQAEKKAREERLREESEKWKEEERENERHRACWKTRSRQYRADI